MMKIIVFGASSGVGREVALQAAAAGHTVTGISRGIATTLPVEGVQLIEGDATDVISATHFARDADVIISAIGVPNPKHPIDLFSKAAQSLTQAAAQTRNRRLIVVSAGGATVEPNDSFFNKRVFKPILWHFLWYLYDDNVRMERIVEKADINWTIMRLARLTNNKGTSRYRTAHDAAIPRGMSIARADVAHYIVQHLADPADYKHHVSIAY